MQVKKFEAPTIQEALETVKRELGPEAIILQTKKYKRGFGLMSKASVEVTAAVSERSLQKKEYVEKRIPEPSREAVKKLSADRQAALYEKYADRGAAQGGGVDAHLKAASAARDQVDLKGKGAARKLTATRYIDIDNNNENDGAKRPQPQAQVQAQPQGQAQRPRPALNASERAAVEAPLASGAVAGKLGAGMSLEEEVRHLKRMVEELKTAQEDGGPGTGAQALMSPQGALGSPALQDAFEQLVVNGIDKRYALALTKKVGFELGADRSRNPEHVIDQMASEIMESTEVVSPLAGIQPGSGENGPAVIALVGPTGVGKTTTVAKMASEALLRRGLKVGLINLDSYKVAAFDQLGTYAKILNVPFRSVGTIEDLKAAISDFHTLDLVLIDTTGRSQRDPASLKEMQGLLAAIPNMRTHLVLSVTTRDTELYDMANRFQVFRPEGIIASKLDEATIYGALYNVSQKAKLPLLYFTTGQRVPEDIEEATQERVAALILDI